MKVATQFRSESPITNDQIAHYAPSVMAGDKHSSRSKGYTYVPTIQVINKLRSEGFQPFYVGQSGTRDESRHHFTRHMVRLRHANSIGRDEANEIILLNSHDGTSSYQLMAGNFRFVCANGLFTGDKTQDIRVPHRGRIVDDCIEGAYTILKNFDEIDEQKERMKISLLKDCVRREFAQEALKLRWPEEQPFDSKELLSCHRSQDREPSVWNVFNVVQENLLTKAIQYRSKDRWAWTRPVKSIPETVKMNKALWAMAKEAA